jgi:hypothetical protein
MTTEKKSKASPESIVREIKRSTRRKFTAEEKIRIVLEGLCGPDPECHFFFACSSSTSGSSLWCQT